MNADDRTYILLTGSRGYPDRAQVIDNLNRDLTHFGPLYLMHGDCAQGPDAWGSAWADSLPDFQVLQIKRPVTGKDWGLYGPSAGPRRNQGMVDEMSYLTTTGAVVRCRAFISACTSPSCRRPEPHDSHGASGCADMAEAAGLWTTRHRALI